MPEGIKRVFSSFEREVKHFKTNPKPREHFELADKVEHAEIVFVITSVNDFFPSDKLFHFYKLFALTARKRSIVL